MMRFGRFLRGRHDATKFVSLSDVEHVRMRPAMYVGAVHRVPQTTYVVGMGKEQNFRWQHLQPVPGLVKLFDEVITNAADNVLTRPANERTRNIHVTINEKGITVRNDGLGIPVEKNKKGQWLPSAIMSQPRYGSNFNEVQTGGGCHGMGAKLCNFLSTRFEISTLDSFSKKHLRHVWNGFDKGEMVTMPVEVKNVTTKKGEGDYTEISFTPDHSFFNLQTWRDPDSLALMHTRVYEVAAVLGSMGANVYLNGKKVTCNSIESFAKMFTTKYYGSTKSEDGVSWEIHVAASPTMNYQSVAFTNGIHNGDGGQHIESYSHILCQTIHSVVQREKTLGADTKRITTSMIKNLLQITLSCHVKNPSFEGQTKRYASVNLPPGIGGEAQLTAEKIAKNDDFKKAMQSLLAKRTTKSGPSPQLEDAYQAGTHEDSKKCALYIVEGDSAKAFAMWGLTSFPMGRNFNGIYTLRGKIQNVSNGEASSSDGTGFDLISMHTLAPIMRALGVNSGVDYSLLQNQKALRYGSVVFTTDQDDDGAHIKGLLLLAFHKFAPSLFKIPGFIRHFVTPLVKVFPPSEAGAPMWFYSRSDFQKQWDAMPKSLQERCTCKYYKGLGTSTEEESAEYFQNIEAHSLPFVLDDDAARCLSLAFTTKETAARKEIIATYVDCGDVATSASGETKISSFCKNDLARYFVSACERTIPHAIDGLKDTHRKILYVMMTNPNEEIKVSRLQGKVAVATEYCHGETFLGETITNLAATYVGWRTNIPFLKPIGQFGTRHMQGKDAANGRYISTKLQPWASHMFPAADLPLLPKRVEEGKECEPTYFVPVVPLVFATAQIGVGVGHSSQFAPHSINDLITATALHIWDKKASGPKWDVFRQMKPYFNNYTGRVVVKSNTDFATSFETHGYATITSMTPVGKAKVNSKDYEAFMNGGSSEGVNLSQNFSRVEVTVTELPIGIATPTYIQHLHAKGASDIVNESTGAKVRVSMVFNNVRIANIAQALSLRRGQAVMPTMLSKDNKIFTSFEFDSILSPFVEERMALYQRQKSARIALAEQEKWEINEKLRLVKFLSESQHREDVPADKEERSQWLESCGFKAVNGAHAHLNVSVFDQPHVLQQQLTKAKAVAKAVESATPLQFWAADLLKLRSHTTKPSSPIFQGGTLDDALHKKAERVLTETAKNLV